MYSDQVKNLERYIQPKAKDFGLFSGLVACAVFVVLMAAVTIAGFKGTTALIISVMLALIAGFGFGALKFRDWLGDFLGGHGRAGSA